MIACIPIPVDRRFMIILLVVSHMMTIPKKAKEMIPWKIIKNKKP